nr:MAG TPA_asm: minor capsid protein [Caudoviricetes sp.]
MIDKRCKGINQNYKRSYGRIRRELRRIYDEYEVNGQLSFDDLKKFRELERIDSLTARVLVGLFKDNKKIIDKLLKDTVDRTYKESIKTLDKGLEVITKPIVAKDIVRKEVAGRVWVERVDHQAGNLNYDVTSLIRAGMERGDSYTQIARDLKKKLAKDNASLNRLARTEGARVIEDSKYSTFEDIAKLDDVIVYKIWHTMADEVVRSSHQAMEGVKVKFDENFTLPSGATCLYPKTTGYPEEDINCRCYVEYVTEIKDKEEI